VLIAIVLHGVTKKREVFKMNVLKKVTLNIAAAILLFSMCGCTLIGIGVGAVAGSGTAVGMLGGAVIGGVVGHEIGD
jgi:osmotically inducible lipoprotein OsmB